MARGLTAVSLRITLILVYSALILAVVVCSWWIGRRKRETLYHFTSCQSGDVYKADSYGHLVCVEEEEELDQ